MFKLGLSFSCLTILRATWSSNQTNVEEHLVSIVYMRVLVSGASENSSRFSAVRPVARWPRLAVTPRESGALKQVFIGH